jgi:antirestriction protein ArdC
MSEVRSLDANHKIMPSCRLAGEPQSSRRSQPCGIIRRPALCRLCRCRHKTHWTKHETRLNRDFGRKRWGDEGYAAEELVAELGSAFLCADLGLTPEPRADHVSYIENWLRVLTNDKRAIFTAAGYAERAAAFLHGLQPKPTTTA